MRKEKVVEITVQDVFSVKAAIEGGANRIELCTALGVAGLTPSIGLMERAVAIAKKNKLEGFVDVLIRPREGDFFYNNDEIETAILDIKRAVSIGVDGVVIGALNEDGTIDKNSMNKMIEAAGKVPIVFHRAFDVVSNQFSAIDDLIELGVVRVLTSGASYETEDGVKRIGELVNYAKGRIEIMAAGGVKIEHIKKLFDIGVNAVHLSARKRVIGGHNRPGEKAGYYQVDKDIVRSAILEADICSKY